MNAMSKNRHAERLSKCKKTSASYNWSMHVFSFNAKEKKKITTNHNQTKHKYCREEEEATTKLKLHTKRIKIQILRI